MKLVPRLRGDVRMSALDARIDLRTNLHDLFNLLTVIACSAESLNDPATTAETVDDILDASRRAIEVVRGMWR